MGFESKITLYFKDFARDVGTIHKMHLIQNITTIMGRDVSLQANQNK
jgi:hypothetical protein